MYNKSCYCILLYVVTCTRGVWLAILEHENPYDNYNKIVGGDDTEIVKQPYNVLLVLNNGDKISYCGGSIVSKKNIVTSAGCLEGVQTIKARIGSTYSNFGGTEYLTNSYTIHPRYNNNTHDFDVAVVNIEEGMALDGESSSAIRLPSITSDAPDGEVLTVTGWGATEEDGKEPNLVLQMGKVSVISRSECSKRIRGITSRMLCAEGPANICQSDYGGPAVGQQRVLMGIAAYGPKCGEELPGVYTRLGEVVVRSYLRVQTGV